MRKIHKVNAIADVAGVEAAEALSGSGTVAPVRIVSRVAFADAFGLGLGVTEYEPGGKAATEIRALWQWIDKETETR